MSSVVCGVSGWEVRFLFRHVHYAREVQASA